MHGPDAKKSPDANKRSRRGQTALGMNVAGMFQSCRVRIEKMAIGVKLERDARRAALLASPLFQAMRPVELDEILKFSTERQCPRGAIIVQQGDEGSSMMAVLRGRVRVSVVSP